ncbi:helix-turn-helix domain-containing protein [Microbacterium sp. H1-D42]|uniref:helix-turn-helix domain-containing protein n=1 Tax=Microbacterium sp. H1-D42 TaxID=2925844 RepID=UPI001F53CC4C|nr:helix-turn-helix domain-containing protein [Microbacterium sp. H1-D42]UNK72066.1 helix-turn-helix domain-containing protein [Microbacterium sp. H1-D42]
MPRRAHDFRGLTQPRRLQLLQAIQRVPGRRAAELADECGIPLNTVRDHLRVLENEGLIRSETVQVGVRGRPPIVFHPVNDADTSDVAEARVAGASMRGRMLRTITATDAAADASRHASRHASPHAPAAAAAPVPMDEAAVRQLDVLYEHLDDAGLDPTVDERTLTFELAPCRYHEMIDDDKALVCGVHARLVKDVLRQSGGPLRVRTLEPFVTEHTCRLVLTQAR